MQNHSQSVQLSSQANNTSTSSSSLHQLFSYQQYFPQPPSSQQSHSKFHSNRESFGIIKDFLRNSATQSSAISPKSYNSQWQSPHSQSQLQKSQHQSSQPQLTQQSYTSSSNYLNDSTSKQQQQHQQYSVDPTFQFELPSIQQTSVCQDGLPQTFRPYLRERDNLGRLIESLSTQISPRSTQLDGIDGDIYKFKQSPSMKQIIREGVEKEEAKRQLKAKNTFGEELKKKKRESLMMNQIEVPVIPTQISMDKFNLNLSKASLAASRSSANIGLASKPISTSNSLFLSPRSTDSTQTVSKIGGGVSSLPSPKKYSLVDTKKKESSPGIGMYDVFNKDVFTFKKQQNTILAPHQGFAHTSASSITKRKTSQPMIMNKNAEDLTSNKYSTIEDKKMNQSKDEAQIVFPKLGAKNKYFLEELRQVNEVQKLQLKPLDEDDNFPLEFSVRMNEVKTKAKRIKEAIVHWTDAAAYHRRQRSEKAMKNQPPILI